MLIKRMQAVLLTIVLLCCSLPGIAFAAESVTLDEIGTKKPGDSVNLSGYTQFDEITVKVLRPNQTVLYVNVLPGGRFRDRFTLAADAAEGIYTVIAGQGDDTAIQTFKVEKAADPTGPTGPGPTVPTTPNADVPGRIVLPAPVIDGSGMANTSVTEADIESAFADVAAGGDGRIRITLQVLEAEGAGVYGVTIPRQAIAGGSANREIEIHTATASLVLPGNMFPEGAADSEWITLYIGLAGKDELPKQWQNTIGDRPVIQVGFLADGKEIAWSSMNSKVAITIPYAPSVAERENSELLAVWYIDEAGRATTVPSGKYDAVTDSMTFVTNHFSMYGIVFVEKSFEDIAEVEWAELAIKVMAAKGIVKGISEDRYAPSEWIKRADFLLLLMRTLGLRAEGESEGFSDVAPSAYYYEAVADAKALGITKGTGDGRFDPESFITRQEMMTMIDRAMSLSDAPLPEGAIDDLRAFSDHAQIADYATDSVAKLVKSGIVLGDDAQAIKPLSHATRAQTAVMMYRIYNRMY